MSKETTLNTQMCPAASAVPLGSMMEALRDAFVELQAASQLSDFAAFKAAMDATATALTALADDGIWDLGAS